MAFDWSNPVGAAVSGVAGWFGAKSANEQNAEEAQRNRDFQHVEAENQMKYQTAMSNSAFQRAQQDMVKAGLNPILAANGGASTPTGASGSGAQAVMSDALGKGVSSALDFRRLKKELEATDSQTALNEATAKAALSQEKNNVANAKVAEKTAISIDKQLPAIEAKSRYETKKAGLDEKAAVFDAFESRIRNSLGTANSAMSLISPKGKLISEGAKLLKKSGNMIINKKGEILHQTP